MALHLSYHQGMNNMKLSKAPKRIHRYAYTRLRTIVVELQNKSYPNKAQLARLIGRHVRTVQRDLEALKEDHDAPIEFDRSKNGFYLKDSNWQFPEVRLTEGELISFFVAERVLRRLSDTAEVRLARNALAKLADYLPEEVVLDIEALEAAIDVAPDPALDVPPKVLRQLAEAASKRQTLHIHYFSQHRNQPTERYVNVLMLHNYLGEWYAVCWDHQSKELRDFHAGRITKLTNTRRIFQIPEDWDSKAYLKQGFGMFRGGKEVIVDVEFDVLQARYARERKFHPTQKNKELPEGRLRVTFQVTEAALEQVARWLMQYGDQAIAIRPVELWKLMKQKLTRAAARYEKSGEQHDNE